MEKRALYPLANRKAIERAITLYRERSETLRPPHDSNSSAAPTDWRSCLPDWQRKAGDEGLSTTPLLMPSGEWHPWMTVNPPRGTPQHQVDVLNRQRLQALNMDQRNRDLQGLRDAGHSIETAIAEYLKALEEHDQTAGTPAPSGNSSRLELTTVTVEELGNPLLEAQAPQAQQLRDASTRLMVLLKQYHKGYEQLLKLQQDIEASLKQMLLREDPSIKATMTVVAQDIADKVVPWLPEISYCVAFGVAYVIGQYLDSLDLQSRVANHQPEALAQMTVGELEDFKERLVELYHLWCTGGQPKTHAQMTGQEQACTSGHIPDPPPPVIQELDNVNAWLDARYYGLPPPPTSPLPVMGSENTRMALNTAYALVTTAAAVVYKWRRS